METVVSEKPTIYTYYIKSHGSIVTLKNPHSGDNPKIYAITIPENIELLTYTQLGLINYFVCQQQNYVCKKYKEEIYNFKTPVFKYTQQFPQLILGRDEPSIHNEGDPQSIVFYSGIIHCIPESRHDSTKKKEIIHNIDTSPRDNCSETSIYPLYKNLASRRTYNTHEEYSKHYKDVLEISGNKREPPLDSINKCGQILLSDAIKIIEEHCQATYLDYERSIIQIHIDACLFLKKPVRDKGYTSVTDLTYFDTYLDTKNDRIIKDTSTIKTYSYMLYKKAFFIQVSKPDSYSYAVLDTPNINKYAHCLYIAVRRYLESTFVGLTLQEKKDILPEEIIISIPNAHLMTDAQVSHVILMMLLQIPGDAKMRARKAQESERKARESERKASRKKSNRSEPYPSSKGGKKRLQKLKRFLRRTKRQSGQRKQKS
jgi:hypothetical protein